MDSPGILQSKILPPRLKRVVLRERLFRLLDTLSDYPVTWVSSPAGSGKTTLIASYARTRSMPMLWYQVDETDNDEATLFYYLHYAAKSLKKGRTRPLPLFTPEYRAGVSAFTRHFFESLFERMARPGIIVFDNYQDAPESCAFHEILRNGLSVLLEGMHAFVISRKAPPASYVSLQAQGGLASVDWEAIRFTGEEVRQIVEQRKKTKVSQETAQRIHEQTQGWAAAIMLTLDHDHPWSIEMEHIGVSSVFDYLRLEVFSKLDDRVRQFLFVTALLPAVSPAIASQLTGHEKSGELLAHLHRNNYFTERYGDEYRFHPLFREFLLTEAERSLQHEKMRELRLQAGRLLLEAGRIEDGMELLMAAGDWGSVVPAIIRAAPGLVSEGRGRTLQGWIEAVPEAIRSTTPWLLYWLGVSLQPYDPALSRSPIERAFELFQENCDEIGTLLSWSSTVWCLIYDWKLRPLGAYIEWFEKHLSTHPSFPSPGIEAAAVGAMATAITYGRPSHPDITVWNERGYAFARSLPGGFIRTQGLLNALGCCFWLGDYSRMELILAETEKDDKSKEIIFSLWWYYCKSYLVIYAGPFHESPVPFIEQGLDNCAKTGAGLQGVPFLLVQGTLGAIDRGDIEKASSFLKQLEDVLPGTPPVIHAQYHVSAGLYYLRVGDLPRALMHVEEMLRLRSELYYPFFEAAIHLDAAFILMEADELQAAGEQLTAYRALPDTTSPILEYSRLIAESALALKHGASDAPAFLHKAFALGKRKRFISPLFSWIPPLMSRLCSTALKAGIEVEHVRYIIRSKGLVPGEAAIDVDAWPWPVKVETLGGLKIRINDEPLTFTGKVQKRPLDLLKLIIAKGGKDVPQDWIEDTLWPEAEGDAANDAFKSTLSRLRKLLKIEGAIEVSGGRLSLNQNTVSLDTKVFENISERVSRLWQNRGTEAVPAQAQEAAQRLIAVWGGDFLKNDQESWIDPYRERLRGGYLRTVRRLTDMFVECGREELASALHEHSLDAGFSQEELQSNRSVRAYR